MFFGRALPVLLLLVQPTKPESNLLTPVNQLNNLKVMLVGARCQATCYSRFSKDGVPSLGPKLSVSGATLVHCRNGTNDCSSCVESVKSHDGPTENCTRACATTRGRKGCLKGCLCVLEGLNQISTSNVFPKSAFGWTPTAPTFECAFSPDPEDGIVLGFDLTLTNAAATSIPDDVAVPVMFALEIEEQRYSAANDTAWVLIGTHQESLFAVSMLKPDTFYQFRVHAVASDGLLGQPVISNSIKTLPDGAKLTPPSEFYVQSTPIENSLVKAIFKFTPPTEKFCFYKLFCMDADAPYVKYNVTFLPENRMNEIQIGQLNFSSFYTFVMVSTTNVPDGPESAEKLSTTLDTISCIRALGYNFTLCGPGPPSHLRFMQPGVIGSNGTAQLPPNFTGDTVSVRVNWEPPEHTGPGNPILGYYVTLYRILTADSLRSLFPYSSSRELSPIENSVTFAGVPRGSSYKVTVRAHSKGGQGEVAAIHITLPGPDNVRAANDGGGDQSDLSTGLYVGISSAMVGCILIVSATLAYRSHRYKKKKAYNLGRLNYFQGLDPPLEREAELSPKSDIDVISDFTEKGEVDFGSLCMGEVLGQGCFGLVRKALMWSEHPWPHWDDVAVKMLRPDSSEYDKSLLLEEIEIMKGVGFHSNIVGVLGYSTKPANVCLVMEYCPLGDLQTYLRKFREPEQRPSPTPGNETSSAAGQVIVYSNDSAIGSCMGNYSGISHKGRQRDFRSTSSGATTRDGGGSEVDREDEVWGHHSYHNDPGSWTSDYSSTEDALTENSGSNIVAPSTLLSYGRQIAMGMDYLSQNKLVHRDLAARNVLVQNPRVVKIADFGLTKDVYESSVYTRRTDGKLPIKWLAHESIFDQVFTSKSDVWAFGILLWEIVTLGAAPYPGIEGGQLIGLLKQGYRMTRPSNCSEILFEMMQQCWQTNPLQRPTFSELRRKLEEMLESSQEYLSLDLEPDYDELQQTCPTVLERQPLNPTFENDR